MDGPGDTPPRSPTPSLNRIAGNTTYQKKGFCMRQGVRNIHIPIITLILILLLCAPVLYAIEPVDAELVERGDEFLFSSEYEKAAEKYREALEHLDSPVVLLRYAFCLGETGRYDESLALFEEAVDSGVPFRDTPMAVAGEKIWDTEHWLERLGNPEEAIYHYTDALGEFPRSPTITYALAWAYNSLYNREKAISYFKETIKNDPLYRDVYASLGSILYEEGGEPHLALHYLNISLLLNPTGSVAESLREKRNDILKQLQ